MLMFRLVLMQQEAISDRGLKLSSEFVVNSLYSKTILLNDSQVIFLYLAFPDEILTNMWPYLQKRTLTSLRSNIEKDGNKTPF